MSRKSPEARTIAVERRIADRYGRKAENRHARRVKAFERNAADYDYESSRVSRKAKMGLTMPSKDARYRAGVNVA